MYQTYGQQMFPNPYQQRLEYYQQQQTPTSNPRTEIIRVNGKNGAEAYIMPPNSSALLLDESAPIVWLKKTDGAGYPTITPYSITPHEEQPTADISSLEQRIKRIEDYINEQSNSTAVKQNTGKSNSSATARE